MYRCKTICVVIMCYKCARLPVSGLSKITGGTPPQSPFRLRVISSKRFSEMTKGKVRVIFNIRMFFPAKRGSLPFESLKFEARPLGEQRPRKIALIATPRVRHPNKIPGLIPALRAAHVLEYGDRTRFFPARISVPSLMIPSGVNLPLCPESASRFRCL